MIRIRHISSSMAFSFIYITNGAAVATKGRILWWKFQFKFKLHASNVCVCVFFFAGNFAG